MFVANYATRAAEVLDGASNSMAVGEGAGGPAWPLCRGRGVLRHPNLVSLYELYADDDRRFFTMKLLDGGDYLAYLHGPAPGGADTAGRIDRLRRSLPQLLDGLQTLHAAGKLHRDIKPSNVMVARDGRLVLVDFGLASQVRPETNQTIAGTAAYMSPEQAAGRPLTPASDWYSVGVMLFQALTGRLPFTGEPLDVMARKQVEEALPLDYWARKLPDDLQTLCADLLRVVPGERPDGAEVAARLGISTYGAAPPRAAGRTMALSGATARSADAVGNVVPTGPPWPAGDQLFVGRQSQLRDLQDAFDSVVAGLASVVLVRGPSGVGKTALCAEFLRQLARRRATGNRAVALRRGQPIGTVSRGQLRAIERSPKFRRFHRRARDGPSPVFARVGRALPCL